MRPSEAGGRGERDARPGDRPAEGFATRSPEAREDQRWRRRITSGSKDAINDRTWGLNLDCGHLVFRPSEYSLPPDLMTDCEVCAAMPNPMPNVESPEGPQEPRCRHCGERVEKAEANSPWEWVHIDGWYRCSALQNTLATPGRRWVDRTAEDLREGGSSAGISELGLISLLLRQAAREHLGLKDGDYWSSGVADAQAAALFAAGMRLPGQQRRVNETVFCRYERRSFPASEFGEDWEWGTVHEVDPRHTTLGTPTDEDWGL